MKLQKTTLILCTLVTLSLSASVLAKGTVVAKIGTLGAGLEYVHPVTPKIAVGLGLNGLSINETADEEEAELEADLKLSTVSLLGDFHPWGNGFRISGGLMSNRNKLSLDATPSSTSTETIQIGDAETEYNVSDLGSLNSSVAFKSTAPYLGIGWGHAPRAGKGFAFDADIGVLFQGSPITSFTATCGTALVAEDTQNGNTLLCDQLDTEVEEQSASLKTDSEEFDMYPVISVGVSYRF